ncbi:hypothetical protein Clacol_000056 [Clathrus columnatus]|uniref:Uncharacterized protein n=1 Tax=Clathrus columnatus TaxID=1419009 RepID=A0AAV4ZY69_9AGAM|nr:hypothetical protein Clacol_000056 [Clathrus columnatus]
MNLSLEKPPSDRVLRGHKKTNESKDDELKMDGSKGRAPEIPWMKNNAWTFLLIDYLENNVNFQRKLFSDATKDAKLDGRRCSTAKNSKAYFHSTLARYIFDEANQTDEDLHANYKVDEAHYARSVGGQLQCLKKKYKYYCGMLGATGTGLDPTDIEEGSDIANKIDEIKQEWPFWEWLHALWRELPNYNPVGISSSGLNQDYSENAASLWTRKSPELNDNSEGADEDRFSDSIRMDSYLDRAAEEEKNDKDIMQEHGTSTPYPHLSPSPTLPIHRLPPSTTPLYSTPTPSLFPHSFSPSLTTLRSTTPSSIDKRTISELFNTDFDVAESQRLANTQHLKYEEKLAKIAFKTEKLRYEKA